MGRAHSAKPPGLRRLFWLCGLEIASWCFGSLLGRSWRLFSGVWLLLAAACLAKVPPDAQKRPLGSMLGLPKRRFGDYFLCLACFWFSWHFIHFRAAAALNFLVLCGVREKRANGLRPTITTERVPRKQKES